MERDLDLVVAELVKSPRQTVKFSLRTFKGRRFVDIRTFSPLVEGGEPRPTAKGVSVPPELWAEFRKMIARVDQALCEKDWLGRENLTGD